MGPNGTGQGGSAERNAGLGGWIRRFVGGQVGEDAPVTGQDGGRIVGEDTGEYLCVAGHIFRLNMGGRVPESYEEVTAIIRRSGAVIEERDDAPAGFAGAHLAERIYIDTGLPQGARRRTLYQLWARYLCWRDRGGPPASVYEQTPGRDPFSRVAGLFERIATEADPVQPKREPTL